ncbi:MAG: DUF87 domain-containing protein [Xanthobacteraceae bacterium]|jgi:hypothetical protein
MDIDDRVNLVPGHDRHFADVGNKASPTAAEPLGRLVAISGSQVTVQFTSDLSSPGESGAEVTVGSFLGIRTGDALAIGALCDISLEDSASDQQGSHATGRIDLLGEIVNDRSGAPSFHRGIIVYPKLGSTVVQVGSDELQIIFDLANPHTIEVGRLQQNGSIAAYLNIDEIVRKHFAIVGSTGAGKSTALALILRKIVEARNDLRVLLIDAHNEYAECFGNQAHVVGPGNLRLPFWLFNFDEIVQIFFGSRTLVEHEVSMLADLIPLAKTEYARARSALRASYRPSQADGGRYTVDTPVPYRFEDVIALAESRMGKLENVDVAVQYQRLLMRINTVRKHPRYSFIFDDTSGGNDTMVDILSQLLRLKDDGQSMAIVQLAGFPAETMEVIVSVLFRLAFEFGVWSDGLSPLLIVCEEAHNYANADRAIGFRGAREGLSRIAKEGRKHGVFLALVTQRPHQLDPTLISQCSTVFAMRLGHEDDQRIVRAAVSDPASRLLAFLPSLGTREALVIGAGVPTVMRLRFDELPDHCIPKSQAVWGGNLESENRIDEQLIASVVARWRGTATTS